MSNPENSSGRVGASTFALLVSAAVTLGIVAVAFFLPVPFVKLSPGPTFNVIGDVKGTPVIQITGEQTFPTTGELDMTTVRESGGPRGGLTFVDAIGAWFNASDAVVPRELIYPDDISGEAVKARNAAAFSTSESNSVAAALRYLDLPVETKIVATAVIVGAPAVPHLTPVNVAVPFPVLAACLSNRTKDFPATFAGIVNVQAVDAVNVAVCTVPLVNAIVEEVVTVPMATTAST